MIKPQIFEGSYYYFVSTLFWLKHASFFDCFSYSVVLRPLAFLVSPLWISSFFVPSNQNWMKYWMRFDSYRIVQNYHLIVKIFTLSLQYSSFINVIYTWINTFGKSKHNSDLCWAYHELKLQSLCHKGSC